MNGHFDSDWERRLDDELKALPDVEAPATLIPGVMQRVRAQAEKRSRWSWHAWSPAMRAAFLALLTTSFATAVWVAWRLWEGWMTMTLFEEAQQWMAAAAALARAAWVLLSTLALGVQTIPPIFLAVYCALAIASYFACVGAGTVAYRYAMARRRNPNL